MEPGVITTPVGLLLLVPLYWLNGDNANESCNPRHHGMLHGENTVQTSPGSQSGYSSPPAESSVADQDNGHEGLRGFRSDDETNHDETACTPDRVCDSQTPLQKFNALKNEDTTDSEDESCSDSCLPGGCVELCMNAVCALYQQQIFTGKSAHGSCKHGVFSHIDSISERPLAEYLIDGDLELRLKKSVSDVKEQRANVLSTLGLFAAIMLLLPKERFLLLGLFWCSFCHSVCFAISAIVELKEERAMLLEEWLNTESSFGELADVDLFHAKLKKLKKREAIESEDGPAGLFFPPITAIMLYGSKLGLYNSTISSSLKLKLLVAANSDIAITCRYEQNINYLFLEETQTAHVKIWKEAES
ncbi:UNVERIFIED_CONTAM: hypothetical protein Scaly_2723900 [Sesamum calycinum]|uniref:Uncharacterized protein n=1 Tax=Sesamum calycinum TaxID=2727403 RepID=A0AAW2J2H7_9LAMI